MFIVKRTLFSQLTGTQIKIYVSYFIFFKKERKISILVLDKKNCHWKKLNDFLLFPQILMKLQCRKWLFSLIIGKGLS